MNLQRAFSATRWAWPPALLLALAGLVILLSPSPAVAQSPPATPGDITVTRADGTLTASWNAVATATKYHVTYSSDGGGSWAAAPCGANCASPTVTIGVDNGNSYIVAARAGNEHGWSGWRNSPSTPPYQAVTPPDTPSSVSVTRTDGALNADWPDADRATGYHVTYSSNSGQSWSLAAYDHAQSDIVIGGADNAKSYVVAVRALNSGGGSGWRNSPQAGPYTPPTPTPTPAPTPTPTPVPTEPPDTPAQVTISRGNGTMTISWPAVDTASGYTVLASSVRDAEWRTQAENHQGTSITVTGVYNQQSYHAAVRAENSAGNSEYRVSAAADPYSSTAGDKPDSVILTRSHRKLSARWQSGWSATKYHVTYSSDGGQSWSLAAFSHPAGKGNTVIEITGVDNAKSYMVGVRGRNKHGGSGWINSNTIGPLNVSLAVSSVTAMTAAMTLSNHDGDWHYKADAAPDDSCSAAQSEGTVNLAGLTPGTTYTYAAYEDSGCTNLLATAEAFTTGSVVTVSNLDEDTGGYTYPVGRVDGPQKNVMVRHSTHFTTGENADGYTLNQVTVSLDAAQGSPTGLTAKVYTGVASGVYNVPDSMVKNLGKKTPTSNGDVTWSCAAGCDLSADTTYHLVLEADAPASGNHHYTWVTAFSYDEVNEPEDADWAIGNRGLRQDGDGAWGGGGHIPGKLSVTATPK